MPSLSTLKTAAIKNATAAASDVVKDIFGKIVKKNPGPDDTPETAAGENPEKTVDRVPVDYTDLRVRISMPPGAPDVFYMDSDNSLLAPLKNTHGFIFPIQPAFNVGHNAEYQSTKPTHTNFPYYHWQSSEIAQISLQGEFPIRTADDARYVMAGIHFLRSLTRGFNSRDKNLAGAPPMVVRLNGMGFAGYDNLPVAVSAVTVNYPDSVDFITFKAIKNELARMPSSLSLNLTLLPIFSRTFATQHYTTLNYSNGTLRLYGPNDAPNDASKLLKAGDDPNVTL